MNTEMIWKIPDQVGVLFNMSPDPVFLHISILKLIDLLFWQPEHFSQFTLHRLRLKCGIRSQQANVIFAVTLKYIVYNFIAVLPAEVDVEVRRNSAFGIQESFKIQIKLKRIYVSNIQTVRYN